MFHRENEVLRQGTGIAVEGATIEVYVNGTDTAGDYSAATRATIYPANVVAGAIADATVTSDEFGHYAYYVPSGVYDEVLTYGSIVKVDSYIQMFDMAGFTSDAEGFADAAAASAVAAAASATGALASKNDAAASATAAATSATDAAASAVTAGAARDAAVTAELAAEAAANASETSASNAAISETNAAASAALLTGMLDTDGTLAANSDAKIPSQKAVKTYVGAAVGGVGALLAANNLSDVGAPATAAHNIGLGTADSPQFTGVNIGHATDTTVTRTGAGDIAVEGNAIYRAGGTDVPVADGGTGSSTAAGARTNLGAAAAAPSIQAVASSATVTPTFADDQVNITAQAAALNLANPTGTAVDGWGIVVRIKDNGTARAITYGGQYRAIGVTLPTTTVISKTLYLGMVFNNADTKWDVVAVAQEA